MLYIHWSCFQFIWYELFCKYFIQLTSNDNASGDVLLELDFENMFLLGLGCFLVSHAWYIIGFLKSSPIINVKSLFFNWIPSLFWSALVLNTFYDKLGSLALPVSIYSFALTILWMSGSYILKFRKYMSFAYRYSPLIGAILFSFSDALIALNKFRPETFNMPVLKFTTIITYWIAQLCISITAIKYECLQVEDCKQG